MEYESIRLEHRVILEWVTPHSSVLDLGCGNGELLYVLIKEKNVRGQGIEIDDQAIYNCVAKGLNVFHGDIDSGLAEYSDKSFDYVVLNQSLQQVRHLEAVFLDALRVGKRVIVGFPNFAFYKARLQLFFKGRVPVTPALPYAWYATPNLHFFSIADFLGYCRKRDILIEQSSFLYRHARVRLFPNVLADTGIFLIADGRS